MSESRSAARHALVAFARWAVLALAVLAAGCSQWRDLGSGAQPQLPAQWQQLLDELRAYERELGFKETRNFARLSDEHADYAFCGWASKHVLPYSYEDPAIRWFEEINAEQCREAGPDDDWHFGSVEVYGEIGTPVTPAMLAGSLDRFMYLVLHEDCHDQFELPYGIEEPLCNLIAYRAMTTFAKRKYGWYTAENRAIRSYARMQSRETRITVAHYQQLEALYERYHRRELPLEALLTARSALYTKLERALDFPPGEINNISLASYMTYSRHYGYLEGVLDRLGPDLARTVEFFRAVDARKPPRSAIVQRLQQKDEKSVEVVRAYEQATLETIGRSLGLRTAAVRVP
jgi:hypothetical protein